MNDKALFKLSYGLFVLTANEDGKDNGCIINTVCQVTDNQKQITITVNKGNLTHDMIKNTSKFTVSVIAENASFELFKRFGFASGRDTDKFAGFDGVMTAGNGTKIVTEGTNAYTLFFSGIPARTIASFSSRTDALFTTLYTTSTT